MSVRTHGRAFARTLGVGVLALVLVACSGAPSAGGAGAADTVKQAFSLIAAKDIPGLTAVACAAQKDKLTAGLTQAAGALGAAPGVSMQDVLNAITFDTSKVTIGSATETGDKATVPVSGTLSMKIDPGKMKDIVKKVLQGQGQTVDDATIDTMLAGMGSQLSQDQAINSNVELVKEGGAWKICSDIGGGL